MIADRAALDQWYVVGNLAALRDGAPVTTTLLGETLDRHQHRR